MLIMKRGLRFTLNKADMISSIVVLFVGDKYLTLITFNVWKR